MRSQNPHPDHGREHMVVVITKEISTVLNGIVGLADRQIFSMLG
jgi:hypothetical protein